MKFREFFRKHIYNSGDSNLKLALSITLGVFISILPIWGWQFLTTIGLAHLLRLNKLVAVAASNFSLPPVLPFIIFLSYILGGWILGRGMGDIEFSTDIDLNWIKENLVQYMVGSIPLAFLLSGLLGPLSFLILKKFRKDPSLLPEDKTEK